MALAIPKIEKIGPSSLLLERSKINNPRRFPRDSGMAPAVKGGKRMVNFGWSVGSRKVTKTIKGSKKSLRNGNGKFHWKETWASKGGEKMTCD